MKQFLILLVFLSACTSTRLTEVDRVHANPNINIPPAAQRESEILHSLIIGELAKSEEDVDLAIDSYENTQRLIGKPYTEVSSSLAHLYLERGDAKSALNEIQAALKINPNEKEYLYVHAGLLATTGNYQKAASEYAILAKKYNDPLASVILAAIRMELGQYKSASSLLKQLTAKQPAYTLAQRLLGLSYEHAKQYQLARKSYMIVAEKNQESLVVLRDLLRINLKIADISKVQNYQNDIRSKFDSSDFESSNTYMSLIDSERYLEATDELDRINSTFGSLAPARFGIALEYYAKKDFKSAERELLMVLAAYPDYHEARYYLASVYLATKNIDRSVKEFSKIPKSSQMYLRSRNLAVLVLRQTGEFSQAENIVREALSVYPNDLQLLVSLSDLLHEQGRENESADILEQLVEVYPEDNNLLFIYASRLFESGKEKRSMEIFEQIIAKDPNNAEALNLIAYSMAENSKSLDRADELVDRALKIKPEDAYFIDTKGWIYYKRKDYPAALQQLEKAIRLEAKDATINEHYADILIANKNFEQAIVYYQITLEILQDNHGAIKDIQRLKKKLKQYRDS